MSRSRRPSPTRHAARALRLQRQRDNRALRRARHQALDAALAWARHPQPGETEDLGAGPQPRPGELARRHQALLEARKKKAPPGR